MYKKFFIFMTFISLLTALTFQAAADVRKDNIELFLVIDKSKSMVEEINDVSSYINDVFINEFLIEGDRLVLIQFYGKADIIFDDIITVKNKNSVMNEISAIPANGRFTDIGNALDTLDAAVNSRTHRFERKYLILLTDGKQEAPPESPYYTPDGSFNHEFLENTKTIQKAGWKIMILGIGEDTAVKELAEELATTSEVLDFTDAKPPGKSSSELIGRVLSSGFKVEGNTILLNLRSEGYSSERSVTIEQITYQLPSGNYDLLEKQLILNIPPDSEKLFTIELSPLLLSEIKNDDKTGSLIFKFSGDTPFLPAVFDAVLFTSSEIDSDEQKKSEKPVIRKNNDINWLIIGIVILIVAAVIAFFIIRNLILHRDDDETGKRKDNEISGDN